MPSGELLALTPEQLTGISDSHLVAVADSALQAPVAQAFLSMQQAAAKAGITLAIASGFRSYQRQASIWQRKWLGELTVNDAAGEPLDVACLSAGEKLAAILHWSALPGASRHHWGTDIDVYDASAFADAQHRLQLQAWEYQQEQGPCYALYCWLHQHAADHGFFFPYAEFRGGVAAEPWHLSYAPLARHYLPALTVDALANVLKQHPIAGMDFVLPQLASIYDQYISNICEEDAWTATWSGLSSY